MSDTAGGDLVRALAAEAAAHGEAPPFSDQTLVDVRAGRARVLSDDDGRGAAVLRDGELELAVGREARGRGIGTALVDRALAVRPAPSLAWAHGDAPAAQALAARAGWHPVRRLLQLRAPLTEGSAGAGTAAAGGGEVRVAADPGLPADQHVDAFRPGIDEDAWLDLNAAAFAHHPEQGRMTLDDLRDREREPWFDGADLLLLRRGDDPRLAGSCWLKVEDGIGEFYAVAVRPDLQGQGIGGVLMRAGMARLRGRGLTAAALYVEGDNVPALALYRRTGFTEHAVDVQYGAP
ncbi:mycothiol synthase [Curtobacterium sp. MCBD17_019]|uniref:mycothiol synthase n=1 Tax=Curtobacterium sp. MCBD17_019 TaxID=2175669 RepID=UPI000DA72E3E|nr:mycothiol synthase [Curtobacterium sp. MCBD17_019]PZE74707.1 mycothiol synthase [Curtobacterium sp. MCBD17_019]